MTVPCACLGVSWDLGLSELKRGQSWANWHKLVSKHPVLTQSSTPPLAGQPEAGTPLSVPTSEECPNPLQASRGALASEFISPIAGEGGLGQGLGHGTGWGARPSRKGPREPGQGRQCRKRDPLPESTGASAGHGPGGAGGESEGRDGTWTRGCNPQLDVRLLLQGVPASPLTGKKPEPERRVTFQATDSRSRDQNSGRDYLPELRLRLGPGTWVPSRLLPSPLLPAQVSFPGSSLGPKVTKPWELRQGSEGWGMDRLEETRRETASGTRALL